MARLGSAVADIAEVDPNREALNRMSSHEFKGIAREYFRRRGYAVADPVGAEALDGVDLVVERESRRYFVQCRQARSAPVEVGDVRGFAGVTAAHRASGCFLVTSGRFTDEAKTFAQHQKIGLIDGERVMRDKREPRLNSLQPHSSGRIEPRGLGGQWPANEAEMGNASGDVRLADPLDHLPTHRFVDEEDDRDRRRKKTAWWVTIAGGVAVGGLLLYLVMTLSSIGQRKEVAGPADVPAQIAPAESGRKAVSGEGQTPGKVPQRQRGNEKGTAAERQPAASLHAKAAR